MGVLGEGDGRGREAQREEKVPIVGHTALMCEEVVIEEDTDRVVGQRLSLEFNAPVELGAIDVPAGDALVEVAAARLGPNPSRSRERFGGPGRERRLDDEGVHLRL